MGVCEEIRLCSGGRRWRAIGRRVGGRREEEGREECRTYSKGTLEGDVVAGDTGDGLVGDDSLAVLELGGDIDRLPLDGHLQ